MPGGSSGGAGSAVASGMVPLAIGSDGGGSIRIPASLCGVAGFKATFGVVPREPQWPGWYSLTHLGPLAFTVADCALMTAVMAGPDPLDPTSLPDLGTDLAAAGRTTETCAGCASPTRRTSATSASTQASATRSGGRRAVPRARRGAGASRAGSRESDRHVEHDRVRRQPRLRGAAAGHRAIGADTRGLIEAGSAYSGVDYSRARNEQAAYHGVRSLHGGYDLLLTPAMEVVAFPHGTTGPAAVEGQPIGEHFDDWCHFCYPANLTGAPAISVPMGSAEDGLPVGLQLTGRRLGDKTVLRAAAAWERIAPWPRPPIATADGPTEAPGDTPRSDLRAGMRFRGADEVVTVRRADSPADGELVVETEPPASHG